MGFIDYLARKRGFIKPDEIKTPRGARRSYSAAQISRLTNSWTTTPKPFDADVKSGLRILRARSRDLAQNNDYARRFLALTRSNVIGPNGIVLQARAKDGDQLDRAANQAIENDWADWSRWGSPDVTGQHSWRSLLDLYVTTLVRDGEVLLIEHTNWKRNRHRYALEFVDVESLDVDLNEDLKNGNVIKMGIEFDRYRAPVAYYLLSSGAADDSYQFGPKKYQRIPASRIIHRFLPESAWQSRGVPWMASTMLRMQMLEGYEEAELVAARVASSKMGFFRSDAGEEYIGDDQDEDGNQITECAPGTFEDIGTKQFINFDPTHPTNAYDSFVKGILRGVAAGMGVSYHTLANDLEGVNYSSGRLGALEDRELWKSLQQWIVESFCDRVYQSWLENALLLGIKLENGGTLRAGNASKYRRVSWQPRRWAWVDPAKDMQAHKTAIELGITSVAAVIREQGKDPDEVWLEIEQERKRLKEIGINQPAEAGFFTPNENGADNDD